MSLLQHHRTSPDSHYPQREKDTMTTLNTNNTADADTLLSEKDPLIDMAFITSFTGMTDKWFYKLIQEGIFPKPIKLGRSSRWYKSEVEHWMKQRIADSRS